MNWEIAEQPQTPQSFVDYLHTLILSDSAPLVLINSQQLGCLTSFHVERTWDIFCKGMIRYNIIVLNAIWKSPATFLQSIAKPVENMGSNSRTDDEVDSVPENEDGEVRITSELEYD